MHKKYKEICFKQERGCTLNVGEKKHENESINIFKNTLFVYSDPSVRLCSDLVFLDGLVQLLTWFEPLKVSKHVMSHFPEVILDVFQ